MSQFMFGLGRGYLPASTAKKVDRIAQNHGCDFHQAENSHWFSGPNLGSPFDSAMRDAVFAELQTAGLLTWYPCADGTRTFVIGKKQR